MASLFHDPICRVVISTQNCNSKLFISCTPDSRNLSQNNRQQYFLIDEKDVIELNFKDID